MHLRKSLPANERAVTEPELWRYLEVISKCTNLGSNVQLEK